MRNTRALVLFGATFFIQVANADTYTYVCNDQGKNYSLKVDDTKNTLAWRGVVYNLPEYADCAKFGWRAEKGSVSFDFCTATQGYAYFELNGTEIKCDQTMHNNQRVRRR